jgi:LmbE family N-acetylglucosaminyl deacetylase
MAPRRILIVASHPDDEILGVGGTIAKHTDTGDDVHILIVAEGLTSRAPARDVGAHQDALGELERVTCEAADILGARRPVLLRLPDNRLDSLDLLDVIKPVEQVVRDVKPSIVYTHHRGDLNLDHGIVHRAVLTACRPLPPPFIDGIYCFETPSSTEWGLGERDGFVPTHFVGIGETLDRKLAALRCYSAEMRPFPHARSLEAVAALARVRGSQSGVSAAEAFVVSRSIWG